MSYTDSMGYFMFRFLDRGSKRKYDIQTKQQRMYSVQQKKIKEDKISLKVSKKATVRAAKLIAKPVEYYPLQQTYQFAQSNEGKT